MARSRQIHLSRRERQIMDIVYRLEEATVAQVLAEIPDPPTYTTIRTLLRLLEKKGHLKHRQDGPRYVFFATVPPEKARESAMRQLLRTFYGGSAPRAMAALLDMEGDDLSEEDLKRLDALLAEARRKGR